MNLVEGSHSVSRLDLFGEAWNGAFAKQSIRACIHGMSHCRACLPSYERPSHSLTLAATAAATEARTTGVRSDTPSPSPSSCVEFITTSTRPSPVR